MDKLSEASKKLNNMLANASNRYALLQKKMADDIQRESSVRSQYEGLLESEMKKLDAVDREAFPEQYEKQLLRVKDLQLKIGMSTETIVTLQSGLVEMGAHNDEDLKH